MKNKKKEEPYVIVLLTLLVLLNALLVIFVFKLYKVEKMNFMLGKMDFMAEKMGVYRGGERKSAFTAGSDTYMMKLGNKYHSHSAGVYDTVRHGEDTAAQEVMVADMVADAIEAFTRDADAAVAEINDPNGKYVNGDVYVFALRGDFNVAHPVRKELVGTDISDNVDINGGSTDGNWSARLPAAVGLTIISIFRTVLRSGKSTLTAGEF